jgi:2-polyprenyl-3-methyl-5-hydroxy-6-metoxy-1,4-benzoquinol methylase
LPESNGVINSNKKTTTRVYRELYRLEDKYLVERVNKCLESFFLYSSTTTNLNIADFGCGDLRASNVIHKQISQKNQIDHYYCIDIKAPQERNQFEIIEHDLNSPSLNILDESIDFAIALELIEHLWNVDVWLKEVQRILKPKGLFFLSTPNIAAWYNRILFLFGFLPVHYEVSNNKKYGRPQFLLKDPKAVGHIRVFTPSSLSQIMNDNGFEIIKCKGLAFIEHGISSKVDQLFARTPSIASTFSITAKKCEK